MKFNLSLNELNELMSRVRNHTHHGGDLIYTPTPNHNPIPYSWFLEQLDDDTAAQMNCNGCRKWWNHYAAAISLNDFTDTPGGRSVHWRCLIPVGGVIGELATNIANTLETHFNAYPDYYVEDSLNRPLKGVKRYVESDHFVGVVGNHFGHHSLGVVNGRASKIVYHNSETKLKNCIRGAILELVVNGSVVTDLLSVSDLRLVSAVTLQDDLLALREKMSLVGIQHYIRLLRHPHTAAREIFRLLSDEKSVYLPYVGIVDGLVDTTPVVDLMNQLRSNCAVSIPSIQRVWNLERITVPEDIPNYTPMGNAPVEVPQLGASYRQHQFTREQILELTRTSRLTHVRPGKDIVEIRAQIPARTNDGKYFEFTAEGKPISLDWCCLNSQQTVQATEILGWYTNPMDVGQGLLGAVVRSQGDVQVDTPSCLLFPVELQQALPDDRQRALFVDAYNSMRPKLTALGGEYVCFDLRNMPMLGVLDGEPIVFVQVRPTEL